MAYRADQFLRVDAALDRDERRAVGLVPGEDAPGVLAYVDPIEDERQRPGGESHLGIEVRRHPEIMLASQPELREMVDEFRVCGPESLTRVEYADRNNFAIEGHLIMSAAHRRAEKRELDRYREEHSA